MVVDASTCQTYTVVYRQSLVVCNIGRGIVYCNLFNFSHLTADFGSAARQPNSGSTRSDRIEHSLRVYRREAHPNFLTHRLRYMRVRPEGARICHALPS